jgi:hypothetical protein
VDFTNTEACFVATEKDAGAAGPVQEVQVLVAILPAELSNPGLALGVQFAGFDNQILAAQSAPATRTDLTLKQAEFAFVFGVDGGRQRVSGKHGFVLAEYTFVIVRVVTALAAIGAGFILHRGLRKDHASPG